MTPTTQTQSPSAGPAPKVCPHCGSEQVRESTTRRGADLLPSNLGKMAYRCRACRGRFHVKSERGAGADALKSANRKKPRRPREPFWNRPSVRRHIGEVTVAGCTIIAFAVFLYLLARSGLSL